MAMWLKLVGAVDRPMPDRWLEERMDLHDEVGFNKRAGVEIGEELVVYAIPQQRIIGIVEVVSHPIMSANPHPPLEHQDQSHAARRRRCSTA